MANAFYTPIKQVAVTVTLWTFIWKVSNSDLSCAALRFWQVFRDFPCSTDGHCRPVVSPTRISRPPFSYPYAELVIILSSRLKL